MGIQIRYGMVGGHMNAFIGEVHRKAIAFDPRAQLVAGCFSTNAEKNRETGETYSLDMSRVYPSYEAMAEAESRRPDGIDFVSITTPNNTHYDVAKCFLQHGIHVVCEKPLCFTVEQAQELVALAKEKNLVFGVTKLTFAVTPAKENGLTLQLPADYTAAGKTTANGAVIADDPGADGEFVWSITISNVPANVTIEELTATLKVTAAGGQIANVTVTQAAGDSTIELDKETINLDVNGTQQTVNVTSNDSWTWAQAAARTVLRMMGR